MNQLATQSKKAISVSFMPPKTIVLVGLMGCGKTSIGKRLAKRLELDFHDSDLAVEESAGCPLADIVKFFGEEGFKSGECRVITRLLDQPVHVLATGGASFSYEPTRSVIKEKSLSIWLKADFDTLAARVARRNDRLQAGQENEVGKLKELVDLYYPLYEQADIHVETFDEPTNCTVDRVLIQISDYVQKTYPEQYVLKSV
ncbi:MAG: Shikimate kinase 1 [Holosporales bacterium]